MATIGIYNSSVSAAWDATDRLITLDANTAIVCQIVADNLYAKDFYDLGSLGLTGWTVIDAAANSADYNFFARDVDAEVKGPLNDFSIPFTEETTLSGQVRFMDVAVGVGGLSYGTGDASDLSQRGYLSRIHPADAVIQQDLDYAQVNGPPWRTLKYPNRYGTYDRFTLVGGTIAPQNTYTPFSRIYEDHLCGIQTIYYDDTARNWASCLKDPASNNGFWLGTSVHYTAVGCMLNNNPLLSTPARGNVDYWTSSTVFGNSTRALQYYNRTTSAQQVLSLGKTSTRRALYFRYMDYELT